VILDFKKQVREAQEVNDFIGQPHVKGFFEKAERDFLEKLISLSPSPKHDETRYRYKVAIEVTRNVRKMFDQVLRDGKVAEHRLELDKTNERHSPWM
jgi:hypothetical protein